MLKYPVTLNELEVFSLFPVPFASTRFVYVCPFDDLANNTVYAESKKAMGRLTVKVSDVFPDGKCVTPHWINVPLGNLIYPSSSSGKLPIN